MLQNAENWYNGENISPVHAIIKLTVVHVGVN